MLRRAVTNSYRDSNVHGANMGPIWGQQDLGGPMLAPWTLLSGYVWKRGISYVNQTFNARLQTPQRQSIAKPETPLGDIFNFDTKEFSDLQEFLCLNC